MIRRSACALGLFALALAAPGAARADAGFQTIYTFTGAGDGDHPRSGLVLDAEGNLYGTAQQGGIAGQGTVFELTAGGQIVALHQFKGGHDGAAPIGAPLLIDRHGALTGTTVSGGTVNGGTVWRLKDGKMKVLHSFGAGNDGYWPYAGLMLGDDGSLTGTTQAGGANCAAPTGCGTVFRIAADGTETVLHAFAGGRDDGAFPSGTLVRDKIGNLYGVTNRGGSAKDYGTVFKITPAGNESVFHAFPQTANDPYQGLLIDKHGRLYGTTQEVNSTGTGVLFELDGNGHMSVLHTFGGPEGDGTGLNALIRDGAGNLYGTTAVGGGNQTGDCHYAGGCGSVFMLAPDGTVTILHAFGGTDGQYPSGGVVSDGHGNLYGTTAWGGPGGHGTIFKLTLGAK